MALGFTLASCYLQSRNSSSTISAGAEVTFSASSIGFAYVRTMVAKIYL